MKGKIQNFMFRKGFDEEIHRHINRYVELMNNIEHVKINLKNLVDYLNKSGFIKPHTAENHEEVLTLHTSHTIDILNYFTWRQEVISDKIDKLIFLKIKWSSNIKQ